MAKARPACLRLLRQLMDRALARAWAKTGKRIAARIAIIAITTSNSISVKPFFVLRNIDRNSFAENSANYSCSILEEFRHWLPIHTNDRVGDTCLGILRRPTLLLNGTRNAH